MKELLEKIYPLDRVLVHDDMEKTIDLIIEKFPDDNYQIHEYPVGSKVWTWRIPQRHKTIKAILKDEDGVVYADYAKHPLYMWSYSISVNKIVDWDELKEHIYTNQKCPEAIPWYFKYYQKTWGFSIEHNKFLKMPINKKYHVEIETEFSNAPGLKNLTYYIDYGQEKDFLMTADICHPFQVNDSITGVVAAVELINRFHKKPVENPTRNINFLFCPETIGSIAYLANNEHKIDQTTAGFFTEFIGHKEKDNFLLQLSRNKEDKINKVFEYVLKKQNRSYSVMRFRRTNDEGNINGPGVNIPCPAFYRGELTGKDRLFRDVHYYDEYHTSFDNPDLISEEKLVESVDVFEEVLRIYCSDYTPKQVEKGVLFLSGLDMHISVYDYPDAGLFIEQVVYMLEGDHTVFEIAHELNMEYWYVKKFTDQLFEKGAIKKIII
jgi:aminopeptidase-like protein